MQCRDERSGRAGAPAWWTLQRRAAMGLYLEPCLGEQRVPRRIRLWLSQRPPARKGQGQGAEHRPDHRRHRRRGRTARAAREPEQEEEGRSEEHTSELQSLMRISYAVFCLKKKKTKRNNT